MSQPKLSTNYKMAGGYGPPTPFFVTNSSLVASK